MIFCGAPAISWALVFTAVQPGHMPKEAFECFADQQSCEAAARSANNAFYFGGVGAVRRAECFEQPASKDNLFAPLGLEQPPK